MASWWSSLNPFVEVYAEEQQEEDKTEESEEGEAEGMSIPSNSSHE